MKYIVLAQSEILNTDGRQLSFDRMIDEVNCQETILKFNHGNFGCSSINHIEPDLQCEELPVTNIRLSGGEEFTVLYDSEILTTDNTWVMAGHLTAGQAVKALTYNPRIKHPQLTPKTIISVKSYVEPFIPAVSFEARSDNLLLSVTPDNGGASTLVPLRPTKESSPVGSRC